ncbi:hypothetical protein HUJ05_007719 [Dendroctonus ponderosae]|nr:hypothetical protein HUJ05_007719 [Dendroctonus ponderosae]
MPYRCQKNRKAVGLDGIYSEVIKTPKKEESLNVIVELFNIVYRSGVIPSDWPQTTFITLPKKSTAKRCSNYRLISFMRDIPKNFVKINHKRVRYMQSASPKWANLSSVLVTGYSRGRPCLVSRASKSDVFGHANTCQVDENWDAMQEIRTRIEQGDWSLSVRIRVLRCVSTDVDYILDDQSA